MSQWVEPLFKGLLFLVRTLVDLSCLIRPLVSNFSLQWRHNERNGVSNHQPHDYLLKHLFRGRSKKTSKLRVTGFVRGIHWSPVNPPHIWSITRKTFPFDNVIMTIIQGIIVFDAYFGLFILFDSTTCVIFPCVPETKWSPLCRRHVGIHFLDWNRYCFRLKFHKHCFLGVTIPSIGSGNCSASIRRQAINWTNDGLGPVSLKLFLTEFKFDENLILLSPKF